MSTETKKKYRVFPLFSYPVLSGVSALFLLIFSATSNAQSALDAAVEQSPLTSQGSDNSALIVTQGDDNNVLVEQLGELNSLSLLIQANNVSANFLQQGSGNLIAGVNGMTEFVMSGNNSVVDIVQMGINNQVFGMQLSANSVMSVTQLGNNNTATIIQR